MTKNYFHLPFALAGLFLFCCLYVSPVFCASSALEEYLQKPEPDFSWKIRKEDNQKDYKIYDIKLTSQKWQDIVWTHQLFVIIPNKLRSTPSALLFITGGSNKSGEPNWTDAGSGEADLFAKIAIASQYPVAILRQVPNQPLMGDKVEDALISYTLDQFLKTKDKTWPLLFPHGQKRC